MKHVTKQQQATLIAQIAGLNASEARKILNNKARITTVWALTSEAAALLGCTNDNVRRMIRAGEFTKQEVMRSGRFYRIALGAILCVIDKGGLPGSGRRRMQND